MFHNQSPSNCVRIKINLFWNICDVKVNDGGVEQHGYVIKKKHGYVMEHDKWKYYGGNIGPISLEKKEEIGLRQWSHRKVPRISPILNVILILKNNFLSQTFDLIIFFKFMHFNWRNINKKYKMKWSIKLLTGQLYFSSNFLINLSRSMKGSWCAVIILAACSRIEVECDSIFPYT